MRCGCQKGKHLIKIIRQSPAVIPMHMKNNFVSKALFYRQPTKTTQNKHDVIVTTAIDIKTSSNILRKLKLMYSILPDRDTVKNEVTVVNFEGDEGID